MAPYLLEMRVIRRITESVKSAVLVDSGLILYSFPSLFNDTFILFDGCKDSDFSLFFHTMQDSFS